MPHGMEFCGVARIANRRSHTTILSFVVLSGYYCCHTATLRVMCVGVGPCVYFRSATIQMSGDALP